MTALRGFSCTGQVVMFIPGVNQSQVYVSSSNRQSIVNHSDTAPVPLSLTTAWKSGKNGLLPGTDLAEVMSDSHARNQPPIANCTTALKITSAPLWVSVKAH